MLARTSRPRNWKKERDDAAAYTVGVNYFSKQERIEDRVESVTVDVILDALESQQTNETSTYHGRIRSDT